MNTVATAHPLRPAARPRGVLTRAEAFVLVFGAAGYTKGETAEWLGVGEETIKSQRASIIKKLQAKNFAGAVAIGFARGHLYAEHLDRIEDYVAQMKQNRDASASSAA